MQIHGSFHRSLFQRYIKSIINTKLCRITLNSVTKVYIRLLQLLFILIMKFLCMYLFSGSGMSSLSHIALRMVTQIGLTETINVYQKYSQQHKMNKSASQNGVEEMDRSPHGVVYKLVTHEQRRLPRDYVQRSLMALFLTRCLQKTSFFSSAASEGQNLNICKNK